MDEEVLDKTRTHKVGKDEFLESVFDRLSEYPRPFKYEEEIVANIESGERVLYVTKAYVVSDDGGGVIVVRDPNELERAMLMVTVGHLNNE